MGTRHDLNSLRLPLAQYYRILHSCTPVLYYFHISKTFVGGNRWQKNGRETEMYVLFWHLARQRRSLAPGVHSNCLEGEKSSFLSPLEHMMGRKFAWKGWDGHL